MQCAFSIRIDAYKEFYLELTCLFSAIPFHHVAGHLCNDYREFRTGDSVLGWQCLGFSIRTGTYRGFYCELTCLSCAILLHHSAGHWGFCSKKSDNFLKNNLFKYDFDSLLLRNRIQTISYVSNAQKVNIFSWRKKALNVFSHLSARLSTFANFSTFYTFFLYPSSLAFWKNVI